MKKSFEVRERLLDPRVYKLLMRIHDNIQPPNSLLSLSKSDLIGYIVAQIKDLSDKFETPIFRIGHGFQIYDSGKPLRVRNKGFQEFLAWVGKNLGVDEAIVYHIPFRNQLFNRAWRELTPEE